MPMRLLRLGPEILTWMLILAIALLNLAIYSGVVQGDDAVNVLDHEAETALSRALKAEQDDSAGLPGRFVPTQGRQHVTEGSVVDFCPDGQRADGCYASNPPSSGLHLPVIQNFQLGDGTLIDIPPQPGVYQSPIPRESIPHLQEHAGVFVGYNCSAPECETVVERLFNVVAQSLDTDKRVVMAPSPDLAPNTIGLASWTRVDVFPSAEYTDERVQDFIDTHSCRFDPEGFCE
jgi:hypothetical protein